MHVRCHAAGTIGTVILLHCHSGTAVQLCGCFEENNASTNSVPGCMLLTEGSKTSRFKVTEIYTKYNRGFIAK